MSEIRCLFDIRLVEHDSIFVRTCPLTKIRHRSFRIRTIPSIEENNRNRLFVLLDRSLQFIECCQCVNIIVWRTQIDKSLEVIVVRRSDVRWSSFRRLRLHFGWDDVGPLRICSLNEGLVRRRRFFLLDFLLLIRNGLCRCFDVHCFLRFLHRRSNQSHRIVLRVTSSSCCFFFFTGFLVVFFVWSFEVFFDSLLQQPIRCLSIVQITFE